MPTELKPATVKRNAVFADNLRRIRRSRGMSQQQVADSVGVTFQHVSSWERARYGISAEYLDLLAEALGVSARELIY